MAYSNKTFSIIMARRQGKSPKVMVQRLRKDGTWGKPLASDTYGNETPEKVVERLNKNNPGSLFRLAEQGKGKVKILKEYLALDKMIDELVAGGVMSDLDPVVRSMTRQLHKRYLALTEEEQNLIRLADKF